MKISEVKKKGPLLNFLLSPSPYKITNSFPFVFSPFFPPFSFLFSLSYILPSFPIPSLISVFILSLFPFHNFSPLSKRGELAYLAHP